MQHLRNIIRSSRDRSLLVGNSVAFSEGGYRHRQDSVGHRLGAVQKADRGSEGGIYDVEGRFFHPIDRALTLLLLDRENFGSMIQSGWRVGGLVALLGALLVASLRRGGEKALMPWG